MGEKALPIPRRRHVGIMVQDLADEVLVYDLERHRAHCLNRTAAFVWQHCDGKIPLAEVARQLETAFKVPAGETLVWLALGRLERAHLLQERLHAPAEAAHYSRREFVRKLRQLGVISALLPAVSSIGTPTAEAAVSCVYKDLCPGVPFLTPCHNGQGWQGQDIAVQCRILRCCQKLCVDYNAALCTSGT